MNCQFNFPIFKIHLYIEKILRSRYMLATKRGRSGKGGDAVKMVNTQSQSLCSQKLLE